jgi:RNA-directed DNA polymerase
MKTLYDDVRTDENMFAAWRHVKRSALNSDRPEIRGKASEFEHQHQRHIKRIQTQLREERFKFDGVEGVLKDKKLREAKGKDPRPIAIGTIKNRVVQRALLQVLQPRKVADASNPNSKYLPLTDPRLGKLNNINCSRYGVGGLMAPYGGVHPAIKLVMEAMEGGACHYFQSDIKAFFTDIPTENVIDFIRNEILDEKLLSLFKNALNVHLSNSEELAGYARLFPSGGIGVAQGSSLSAFAGNVLLYDFDHQLNRMDVNAVRYIDDIFVLGGHPQEPHNFSAF